MPTIGQTIPNMGPVQGRSISAYESSDHKVLVVTGRYGMVIQGMGNETRYGRTVQGMGSETRRRIKTRFQSATTTSSNTSQPKGYSLEMAQLIGPRCDHTK
jgi:hypothetical protein